MPAQEVGRLRSFGELRRVETTCRRREPPVAVKQLVRKLDHKAIRPGVGSQLEQPGKDVVLVFVPVNRQKQDGRGGGRTRNTHLAMDQHMRLAAFFDVLRHRSSQRQDGLDVIGLRKNPVWPRLDLVVKTKARSRVRPISLECIRFRKSGIENGQHMRDAARAVKIKLVKPADDGADCERFCHASHSVFSMQFLASCIRQTRPCWYSFFCCGYRIWSRGSDLMRGPGSVFNDKSHN